MWEKLGIAAMVLAAALSPLSAQWLNLKDNIPRNKDGSPNLTAPAPRLPDGKPDLSGLWVARPPKTADATEGLPPGTVELTPEGQALFDERKDDKMAWAEPDANCLPQGIPKIHLIPGIFKVIQQPDLIVFLYETGGQYRQLFMDGRQLPTDPNPQWYGYAVAKWDGDTLVVESSGYNGKAWLDRAGHPSSEAMRTTERFRRIDLGHMEMKTTIDDPKMYKKPWTITQAIVLESDTDLLQDVCENNKDLPHLHGLGKSK
jgi:hypothetical protein